MREGGYTDRRLKLLLSGALWLVVIGVFCAVAAR